jgi:hypothetical protein
VISRRNWTYPPAIAALVFFVLYRLSEYFRGKSVFRVALSAIDLAVLWLIFHEWRGERAAWAKPIKGRYKDDNPTQPSNGRHRSPSCDGGAALA